MVPIFLKKSFCFNLNHSNSNIQRSNSCFCLRFLTPSFLHVPSSVSLFLLFLLPRLPSFSLHPFFNHPISYYLLILISITAIMDCMCLLFLTGSNFSENRLLSILRSIHGGSAYSVLSPTPSLGDPLLVSGHESAV